MQCKVLILVHTGLARISSAGGASRASRMSSVSLTMSIVLQEASGERADGERRAAASARQLTCWRG